MEKINCDIDCKAGCKMDSIKGSHRHRKLFIINQRAGRGISKEIINHLKREFNQCQRDHKSHSVEFIIPLGRTETEDAARNFVNGGGGQVVVIGGDGTVNAVVNGLVTGDEALARKTSLTVGTFGTGSDYFKSLIRPFHRYDWKKMIDSDNKVRVDLGRIEYDDVQFSPKFFTNMASIGLSSQIVMEKEGLPQWLPSKVKYLVPTLKTMFLYPAHDLEISIDDRVYRHQVMTLTISKGTYAGGGMRFGESVNLDDGFFEVTIFKKMNPTVMLFHLSKLYRGSIAGVPEILKIRGKKVVVKNLGTGKLPVEFDGEIYGTTDVTFEVCPRQLRVHRPWQAKL